ncbi:MAG TPA: 4-alpha-glucanotransferase [Chromatiales bacterium]|nr:4-alpha-glucanotransferase [Chromatiales bacterium]
MSETTTPPADPPVPRQRRSGLLLHPTSLPGDLAAGDLGHHAYRFIEFLAASGMGIWQMLPLGPTHADGSPYQCLSVHAGNPALISIDWLVDRQWLRAPDCPADVTARESFRLECLRLARAGFEAGARPEDRQAWTDFQHAQAHWLDDYALYLALRREQGGQPWWQWPAGQRDREPAALKAARMRLAEEISQARFEQFVFFRQWHELRDYAHRHGVHLFGDMPIFVAHDSAEVWSRRQYFALDAEGRPETVAGVPPDYFSATGQYWGNPQYRWEQLQADGFAWWVDRLRTQLDLFDLIRVDHFRGFEAFWEIPASAGTAVEGRWVRAPGRALLQALHKAFHRLPLVAEDLGTITPEVEQLRREFGLPGMKILQFAFDGNPGNPYLPHNHEPDSVVYTGTHDNDTTLAWYESLADAERQRLDEYLGYDAGPVMPWPLVRCALASVAEMAVLPMQDVLGLGAGHRMNLPGTTGNNWHWRFQWAQVPPDLAGRLRQLNHIYGRCDN